MKTFLVFIGGTILGIAALVTFVVRLAKKLWHPV